MRQRESASFAFRPRNLIGWVTMLGVIGIAGPATASADSKTPGKSGGLRISHRFQVAFVTRLEATSFSDDLWVRRSTGISAGP